MALNIEIDLAEMTWADLRKFVSLGEHMPGEAPVETFVSPYDSTETWGLRITGVPLDDGSRT